RLGDSSSIQNTPARTITLSTANIRRLLPFISAFRGARAFFRRRAFGRGFAFGWRGFSRHFGGRFGSDRDRCRVESDDEFELGDEIARAAVVPAPAAAAFVAVQRRERGGFD